MVELNFEKDLQNALDQTLSSFPNVHSLKPEQKLVVEKVVNGRDVFAQLPTGFGKSLTFQVLPAVCKYLSLLGHKFPLNPVVVVVTPLVAIMEDQVKLLGTLGFKAAFVGENNVKDRQIINGEGRFNFVYGSPESLLGDERFRAMYSKACYRNNVVTVVCDEVHTVVDWGESDAKPGKKPFREWCGHLGQIRSLLPGVPLLALTATATSKTRKKIMNLLSFNNGIEIVVSPNRENVKLCVKKVTDDIAKNFSWLAEEIEMNGVACPRTLLYVNNYKSCGEIFSFFMHTLGNKAYWPRDGTKKSTNRIVAMFHSATADKIKEHVLSSLKDAQGNVRIVIATSALGMGVDIKGLHHIIHYGPPSDIESYVQGFGRAGRDGMDSEALLLFHGRQLRLCEPEMLDFVKCDTCRRVKILAFFDDTGDNRGIVPKHLCCDICARDCECGETECNNYEKSMFLLMSKATGTTKENYAQKRDVSEAQRKKLKDLLKQCQEQMREELQPSNLHCLYSSIDQLTCFSNSLIQDVLTKCDHLYSVDDILETVCVWNADHASRIFSCLKGVFEDLQAEEVND